MGKRLENNRKYVCIACKVQTNKPKECENNECRFGYTHKFVLKSQIFQIRGGKRIYGYRK